MSSTASSVAVVRFTQVELLHLRGCTRSWTVYVNAVPDLDGPSLTRVGDGFSDSINDVLADRGQHARATVGVSSLAFGVPTIIEAAVAT